MDDPAPIYVLQMTVFASADEADRGGLPSFAVIAFVDEPLWRFEILETSEAPPVWLIVGAGVANEPARKDGRLYRGGWTLGIAGVYRRRPELRRAVANDARVIFEAKVKETLEPGFLDGLEGSGSKHFPTIEAHDEHRPLREVDHGARAEKTDDLAQSDFVVRHLHSLLN
jgi:hypothetical protein